VIGAAVDVTSKARSRDWPNAADPAAAPRHSRAADPRLHSPRHHRAVRCARGRHREGHRRLVVAWCSVTANGRSASPIPSRTS